MELKVDIRPTEDETVNTSVLTLYNTIKEYHGIAYICYVLGNEVAKENNKVPCFFYAMRLLQKISEYLGVEVGFID